MFIAYCQGQIKLFAHRADAVQTFRNTYSQIGSITAETTQVWLKRKEDENKEEVVGLILEAGKDSFVYNRPDHF